jgi:hypothetical protein
MINLNAGLDKTRLVSNILMLVLVMGNIFFSIQYMDSIKQQASRDNQDEQRATERMQTARFLKFFIDTVLNTKEILSFDNRVKLESDIRQLGDKAITAQWDVFVGSKDSKLAQEAAVKLMSMLGSKMI